ncbi:MAG: aminotransferase class I/II-fold pyridoxal phosphate-dependent enzyme [Magnetococcales bacterium]|nr:aminotransferase class I/II-fold pyridoxal phosphate-dependent enzyme [Magnetococcales bacterium]
MIPLAVPDLTGNEALYLQRCIDSTFVSSVGPFVDRFEALVAEAAGCAVAVATSAGTTGLHAALTALGVERGDLVILPAFTFIASPNAVAHCGAVPWLMDITPDGWTLDPRLLAETLATETERRRDGRLIHRASCRRVAALMPVYTLGTPAAMDDLVACARRLHLPVVADAAAALGARYRGRPLGELGADLTVFSFNGNKTITCGGGGAVAGNDLQLLGRVRHLTTTARVGADYDHDRVGFNYRMTNLQAAVGCAQMERLDRLVAAKRRIRERYVAAFRDLPGTAPFPLPPDSESACWFSGLLLPDSMSPVAVRALIRRLEEQGVGARPFWKPVHRQLPYRTVPRTALPVSEGIAHRVLTLPCSSGLTDVDQDRVIQAVRDCLTRGD